MSLEHYDVRRTRYIYVDADGRDAVVGVTANRDGSHFDVVLCAESGHEGYDRRFGLSRRDAHALLTALSAALGRYAASTGDK